MEIDADGDDEQAGAGYLNNWNLKDKERSQSLKSEKTKYVDEAPDSK